MEKRGEEGLKRIKGRLYTVKEREEKKSKLPDINASGEGGRQKGLVDKKSAHFFPMAHPSGSQFL